MELLDPSTFVLVFVIVGGTELIDRTNFALIGLSARRPALPAWMGATSAFLLTSALAVLIGAGLLALLGGQVTYLRLGGGIFLLAYAAYLALVPESQRRTPGARSTLLSAFLLILLLELGDTTMILLILFTGSFAEPLTVFLAGGIALSCVAGSACLIGSRMGAKIEPKLLDRVVVVILVVVGSLTILYALAPGIFPALP